MYNCDLNKINVFSLKYVKLAECNQVYSAETMHFRKGNLLFPQMPSNC